MQKGFLIFQPCVCHTKPVSCHSNSQWIAGFSNVRFFTQVTEELVHYVFTTAVDGIFIGNLCCLLQLVNDLGSCMILHLSHLGLLQGFTSVVIIKSGVHFLLQEYWMYQDILKIFGCLNIIRKVLVNTFLVSSEACKIGRTVLITL